MDPTTEWLLIPTWVPHSLHAAQQLPRDYLVFQP